MQRDVKKLLIALLLCEISLAIFHYCFANKPWFPILSRLFDVNLEGNIPTWFSSAQLFTISLFALLIYYYEKNLYNYVNYRYKFFWLANALIFGFLSLDESAQLHEILDQLKKIFHYRWVYFYLPFVALCGIIITGFIYSRFRDIKQSFILYIVGGGLYLIGGLGLELIGDNAKMLQILEQSYFIRYSMIELSEEIFEMVGVSLIFCSYIIYFIYLYQKHNHN